MHTIEDQTLDETLDKFEKRNEFIKDVKALRADKTRSGYHHKPEAAPKEDQEEI